MPGFHGLKEFHDFLDISERHLTSDHAVKRLEWAAAFRLAGIEGHPTGFWISQEPPEDRQGPLICSQESAVLAGKGDRIRVDAVEIMGNAHSHDLKFAAMISTDARQT